MAAVLALGNAVVKTVDTVDANVVLHGFPLGKIDLDLALVMFSGLLHQLVSFRRQATCIEAENFDATKVLGDEIGEHHVFHAEAGGKGHRRIVALDPGKQRFRPFYFLFEIHVQCLL